MPMGEYADFDDCLGKTRSRHPDWSDERCRRYCGAIYHKTEGKEGGRHGRRRQRRR